MKKYGMMSLIVACTLLLAASESFSAGKEPSRSVSITAYSSGQALVTEERDMDLPASGEVPFTGAPATLDLTSVALRSLSQPGKVAVGSLRLLPSASDPSAVLRGHIGREVRVVLPDPSDARARVTRKATLLSVGSQAVLDLGDEIYVGPLEAVLLPADAEKPRAEAALLLNVRNSGERRQRVEISYLASGLSWSGDCALTLDEGGEQGALSCWATLRNDTGRAYEDAVIRLVAGEPRRAAAPAPMARYKGAAPMLEANMAMGASQQQAGEYHMFTVPYPADLTEGQVTRLALSAADPVTVGRELVLRGHAFHNPGGSEPRPQAVDNVLVLRNSKENGLGEPLPASLVRVYRDVAGAGRILEGEVSLDNLPAGETARLTLGTAFDVTARRTMQSYERIGKNRARVRWAVELRNAGKKMRDVVVLETFQGDWKITSSNLDYAKESANTARWVLQVPGGSKPVTLLYEAEASW